MKPPVDLCLESSESCWAATAATTTQVGWQNFPIYCTSQHRKFLSFACVTLYMRCSLINCGKFLAPLLPSDGLTTVFCMSQVRKFKEKQERERWKKEKERKKAASEILERHRGNKDSMKAIRRNLNNTKSADKSREILDAREREHRDALEREKDRKNGLRDQVICK